MNRLVRKAIAEFTGTGFLVATVIGSGIAAERLLPGQPGLQLLINALATAAVLGAMITVLRPCSAAFNPVVTLAERLLGLITGRTAIVLIVAQILGGIAGAVVADLMFGLAPITVASQDRSGPGIWLGEAVATGGLILIIIAAGRSGNSHRLGLLVGGYLFAAYWFTSSTSFANPAVTVARTLSDTFAGIRPASVPMFLLMQLIGGAAGLALAAVVAPVVAKGRS